jgi:cyclopropane fatty-acyl-phospholipid synthase-like methyltransferase
LTKLGDLILEKPIFERKIEFIKLILSHSAFKKTLQTYFTKGNIPSTEEVIEIMKSCKLYNVNEYSTYKRRASTVRSWVNWIVEQNEE